MRNKSKSFLVQSNQIYRDGKFVAGWFLVEGEKITRCSKPDEPALSGVEKLAFNNSYVIPGLVDLHVHGYGGVDASHASVMSLRAMSLALARAGTTSFLATLYPLPPEKAVEQIRAIAKAGVLGVHLEGPFVSPQRIGALDRNQIQTPNEKTLYRLLKASPGAVRKMTIAAELPGALELIQILKENQIVVSLGHSDASYSQAKKAISSGASSVTHLFNAMRPFHHRDPGLIGYVLSHPELSCEIIGDGEHVSETVLAWLANTRSNLCLVSDGLSGTKSKKKHFHAGGHSHDISAGAAYLSGTQTLSGSCSTLFQSLQRLVRKGVLSLAKAVELCASNPARELGLQASLGDLQENASANFLVLRKDLSLQKGFLNGLNLDHLAS